MLERLFVKGVFTLYKNENASAVINHTCNILIAQLRTLKSEPRRPATYFSTFNPSAIRSIRSCR